MKKIFICYALEKEFLSDLEERLTQITLGAKDRGWTAYAHIRDEQNWKFHNEPIRNIIDKSFKSIASSDLVLLDLTTKNSSKRTGLNIEAGYAKALGKKIIALWHVSDRPNMTTDLADYEISYSNIDELKIKVSQILLQIEREEKGK